MTTFPAGITVLPPAFAGMRIGLFGGSFNPPHEGHRLVALQALKRLDLDAVWLLVSPGNPLKDHTNLAPLAERIEVARTVMRHPRIARYRLRGGAWLHLHLRDPALPADLAARRAFRLDHGRRQPAASFTCGSAGARSPA